MYWMTLFGRAAFDTREGFIGFNAIYYKGLLVLCLFGDIFWTLYLLLEEKFVSYVNPVSQVSEVAG